VSAHANWIEQIYCRLAATSADAPAIARETHLIWDRIAAALSPIVGQAGVSALYNRSLSLVLGEYAFLAPVDRDISHGFGSLDAALSRQPAPLAGAAAAALLRQFHVLLTKLIGAGLTERLLQPVRDQTSHGDAGQDSLS